MCVHDGTGDVGDRPGETEQHNSRDGDNVGLTTSYGFRLTVLVQLSETLAFWRVLMEHVVANIGAKKLFET